MTFPEVVGASTGEWPSCCRTPNLYLINHAIFSLDVGQLIRVFCLNLLGCDIDETVDHHLLLVSRIAGRIGRALNFDDNVPVALGTVVCGVHHTLPIDYVIGLGPSSHQIRSRAALLFRNRRHRA
jgi:hypothetical protein